MKRTTHMAFGAHQDDLEILGFHGIYECINKPDSWFTGVTCTDGAGSPRTGEYAGFTNDQMKELRWREQRSAAELGSYSAVIQLKYPSSAIKTPKNAVVLKDLNSILSQAAPGIVYTHNLADKHDTHVGVALKVIDCLRGIPKGQRPRKVYGVEIWRGLDWMPDKSKVVLDVSGSDNMVKALIGVFASQIAGGKRYDLATVGRWHANATYLESHGVDKQQSAIFAMDLTPLIEDDKSDIIDYVTGFVEQLKNDVITRLRNHSGK